MSLARGDDEQCCAFCLAGTGPILERSEPYDVGEGRELEAAAWEPYARAVQLDNGWLLLWESLAHEPDLVCSFHASGHSVPRSPATARVGDVEINLQEFDYVGQRGDVAMFKHLGTRRYMNVRAVGPTAVAVDREGGELVYRCVSEALRWARGEEASL